MCAPVCVSVVVVVVDDNLWVRDFVSFATSTCGYPSPTVFRVPQGYQILSPLTATCDTPLHPPIAPSSSHKQVVDVREKRMSNVSADLVWQCTRKHNAFLVKRNGIVLTSEPGNPTNINSAKYSGLASKNAVDVKATKDTVTITMKKSKDQNKPGKSMRVVKVKNADPNRVIATARKLVAASYYRPGAEKVITKRVAKLAQAAVRANKMSAGKLSIKYGRNAAPFPFTDAQKQQGSSSKKAKASSTAAAEDDELPPLAPSGGAADEMD